MTAEPVAQRRPANAHPDLGYDYDEDGQKSGIYAGCAVYGRYHPTNDMWWRKSSNGEPSDDRGFTYESPIRLDTLPAVEWPLSEVVTPEGTS